MAQTIRRRSLLYGAAAVGAAGGVGALTGMRDGWR